MPACTCTWANLQSIATSPCAKKIAIGAAALFVGAKVVGAIQAMRSQARVKALNANNKPDVVYLHLGPPDNTAPSYGAPAAKVASFLVLHKIPHVLLYGIDAEGSPNGLMPFMVLNGVATAESEVIVEEIAKTFKIDLTGGLTKEEQARARFLRLAFDDSARFHMTRQSMVDHPHVVMDKFAKLLGYPVWMVKLFFGKLRKNVIDTLDRQGCGMLSDARYQHELTETLRALETTIGGKKFILTNDKPTQVDVAIWAHLHGVLETTQIDTQATRFVRSSAVLKNFIGNVSTVIYGNADNAGKYLKNYLAGEKVQNFA